MFNPPHPGLTLRDDILPALNLQVGEAAAQLGVDRTTLSKVLNGRAAVMVSKVRLGVKALKLQTA
jgi:addiction module HigA family antidote